MTNDWFEQDCISIHRVALVLGRGLHSKPILGGKTPLDLCLSPAESGPLAPGLAANVSEPDRPKSDYSFFVHKVKVRRISYGGWTQAAASDLDPLRTWLLYCAYGAVGTLRRSLYCNRGSPGSQSIKFDRWILSQNPRRHDSTDSRAVSVNAQSVGFS